MRLILKLLINAAALWAAGELITGIDLEGDFWTILLVALVFGLVNTFIKPILALISMPFIVFTLGLFTLLINTFLLWIVSLFTPLIVDGFIPALLGSIVISLVSWLLNLFVSDD